MQLARKLHDETDVPVIIVTARRDEADRVMGLEMAADDYITKPFSNRELLARAHDLALLHLNGDDGSLQGRCDHHGTLGHLLRESGGNFKLVQKAMNHRDIKSTLRYAHVLDDEVASAMERLAQSRAKSRKAIRKVG